MNVPFSTPLEAIIIVYWSACTIELLATFKIRYWWNLLYAAIFVAGMTVGAIITKY